VPGSTATAERSLFSGDSPLGTLTSTAYVPGPHRTTLDLGGRKLAVFICFESLNARHVRDLVRQHRAEALVNLSSDGWFAEGAEPELHLALASLRGSWCAWQAMVSVPSSTLAADLSTGLSSTSGACSAPRSRCSQARRLIRFWATRLGTLLVPPCLAYDFSRACVDRAASVHA
jgi:hypothetical protein